VTLKTRIASVGKSQLKVMQYNIV